MNKTKHLVETKAMQHTFTELLCSNVDSKHSKFIPNMLKIDTKENLMNPGSGCHLEKQDVNVSSGGRWRPGSWAWVCSIPPCRGLVNLMLDCKLKIEF